VFAASRVSVSARVPVRIMAFSPEGRAGWMHQVPGVPLAFCDCLHVSGNVALYMGDPDGTTAYDATDGRTLWSLPDATYVDGTTAVRVPGECYALGTRGPGTRVYRLDVCAGRLQEVMSVAGNVAGLRKS
jgi:outer membrane protein assembly factor BamB